MPLTLITSWLLILITKQVKQPISSNDSPLLKILPMICPCPQNKIQSPLLWLTRFNMSTAYFCLQPSFIKVPLTLYIPSTLTFLLFLEQTSLLHLSVFAPAVPSVWNLLPLTLQLVGFSSLFRSQLICHIFKRLFLTNMKVITPITHDPVYVLRGAHATVKWKGLFIGLPLFSLSSWLCAYVYVKKT